MPTSAETLKLKAGATLYLQVLEARKSPLGLYRLVFTDELGNPVIIKKFHEEWNALWQQNQNLILISPRESTKTSFALALALWHIGKNPNIRIKWLGPNDGQACKRLATIHEIIAHSALYHMVFPSTKLTARNSKRPNSAASLNVEREMVSPEATVEASGVLSAGTGARTDLLIADDVCVAQGTPIITQRGLLPIEEVRIGDRVRNHKGLWSTVGRTWQRQVPELIEIHAAHMGTPALVTPTHPVFSAKENKSCVWNDAGAPLGFHDASELTPRVPNRPRWFLASAPCTDDNAPPLTNAELVALWPELEGTARGQHHSSRREVAPTIFPEFWWFVGQWLANGWSGTNTKKGACNNRNKCGGSATVTIHRDKADTIGAKIQYIVSTFMARSASSCFSKRTRSVAYTFGDLAFVHFSSMFRRPDGLKECPYWIYNLPSAHRQQLIQGYWDGDGSFGVRDTFGISSVSFPLLVQMRLLFSKDGILCGISTPKMQDPNRFAAYSLKPALNSKPIYKLSIPASAAELLGQPPAPAPQYTHSIIKDGNVWRPVRRVQVLKGSFPVYNLSMIEGENSYDSPLVCSHNCDESNALLQPAMQPKVIAKFLSDWMSTLTSKGRVFYIATPWTTQDLTAYLIKHSGWAHKKYKHGRQASAISNETGSLNNTQPNHSAGSNSDHLYNSMFPERWPSEVLRQRRLLYGAIHYARAYLCEPLIESIVPISPSFLRLYGAHNLTEVKLNQATAILSIDPAKGTEAHKGKTDFIGVCIALLYLNPEPPKGAAPLELFICDAYQFKAPLDVQARHIWQLARDWQAQHVLVEAKGMQSLDSWLRLEQERDPLHTPSSIIDPITFGNLAKGQRLMQAVPLLNPPEPMPPLVWFHPRTVEEAPQPDTVIIDSLYLEIERPLREQLLSFPTTHDDVLDATTQLLNWVRMHYSEGTLSALRNEEATEQSSSETFSFVSL